jgi:hypothetical protein
VQQGLKSADTCLVYRFVLLAGVCAPVVSPPLGMTMCQQDC